MGVTKHIKKLFKSNNGIKEKILVTVGCSINAVSPSFNNA